jgi:2-C-methyl-D-erythritol 4-phosphate cytidylyltransferase
MGSVIPKQFLPLCGKPLLCYAIDAFVAAIPDIQIILVLPEEEISTAEIVLRSYKSSSDVVFAGGGHTRYHSVQCGLARIKNDGIVFVHDGARPLVSVSLIQRCYEQALERGSAIPVIAVADSVRMLTDGQSVPVDRDQLRIIQTPQTFRTDIILPAFAQEYSTAFTDEASVVEAAGAPVFLIEGDRRNLKVTTPEDMIIAEAFIKDRG